MEDWLIGFGFALVISAITTPAGVSGAVFLLPVQVTVLGTPSPSVTPTNLLYNVLAIPGALARFARDATVGGHLTRVLIAGATPGAIVGAVIRVEFLASPDAFLIVIGTVLVPLGLLLLLRRAPARAQALPTIGDAQLVTFSVAVGIIGGIYGIGGGSIIAPVLASTGMSIRAIAPAALTSTFVTSIVGIAAYGVLSLWHGGSVAPDWALGLFLGAGGLIGGYVGASVQGRIPERTLRRGLGLFALALGLRYLVVGLGG
jgi:uncharacterized membrane protein YfcA